MTSSSAKYCAQHKEASHVHMNALTQTCVSPACARWASFGRQGERKSRCAQHKLAGDIDLRNRRCQFRYVGADTDTPQQVCMKQPSYGEEGSAATHCAQHRLPAQVLYYAICAKVAVVKQHTLRAAPPAQIYYCYFTATLL